MDELIDIEDFVDNYDLPDERFQRICQGGCFSLSRQEGLSRKGQGITLQ